LSLFFGCRGVEVNGIRRPPNNWASNFGGGEGWGETLEHQKITGE